MKQTEIDAIIREVPKGLLKWYPFESDKKVIYILIDDAPEGDSIDSVYLEALQELELNVEAIPSSQLLDRTWIQSHLGQYDYAVSIAALEKTTQISQCISAVYKLLSNEGKLLLGMNNRLGLRYFCGDRDPYTDNVADGIEEYRRAYSKASDIFKGRCYAMDEIDEMLVSAGEWETRFYSVLPDLIHPQFLYAHDYLPNEDLARRLFPMYHYPDTVFMEEEVLYHSLIANGLFHSMANAYLIECAKDGSVSDVTQVTGSLERGKEKATYTIIYGTERVQKKAAYQEGIKQLQEMAENHNRLKQNGIAVVEGSLKDDVYEMPYIQAESAQVRLRRLLEQDIKQFYREFDEIVNIILQSSEIEKTDQKDGWGATLRYGYPDMALINCFYLNGTYTFFDQEYMIEHCYANLVIYRLIYGFYYSGAEMHQYIPIEELYKRYGIDAKLVEWEKQAEVFIDDVRNDRALSYYHQIYRANPDVVNNNRQMLNFSPDDYQKIFIDIFRNTEGRKLYLFGSGQFARKFLSFYHKDYPVCALLDNNSSRWGEMVDGVPICSPDVLKGLDPKEYKIIICIKNFHSVLAQLKDMGIIEYAIYDSYRDYPVTNKCDIPQIVSTSVEGEKEKKPYHVGYVAGVFDLFHVGHLRLLKRAKEQCDYLIVGVVSDDGVYRTKHKYPVIPCEDRVEVLKGCRYVDRVEALPTDYAGIQDAYRMFHFDCQFSGDDHGDDPRWQADIEYLKKQGADVVFFNYTEKTSSTRIRKMLQTN